jgi:F1F0 ATPase subunit 2
MNEPLVWALSALGGAALGAVFFGGLWWTVQKGVSSASPALWFLCSGLLRTAIVVAGFYFISAGAWQRLAAAFAGFVCARLLVIRLTRPALANPSQPIREIRHAP